MADKPTILQRAILGAVRGETQRSPAPPPHDCEFTAILGGLAYPCWNHDDGQHHFAARWPACPAPYCRLAPGHRTLHDIPPGRPVISDRRAVERDEDKGIPGDPDSEVFYDKAGHGWHLHITALCTLQFAPGGMVGGRPVGGYQVHLVRQTSRGTPGPTLCGIDRFADPTPGWSVGGGISGPDITHTPCPGCAAAAREQFPGLPVVGIVGVREMAAELGVDVTRRG